MNVVFALIHKIYLAMLETYHCLPIVDVVDIYKRIPAQELEFISKRQEHDCFEIWTGNIYVISK